jgi:anti-anti-sigma regulatory factor
MARNASFQSEGAVIFVGGVFDAAAAVKLRGLTRQLEPPAAEDGGTVVVDFGRAREVTATGLAALMDAFADVARPPRFRGLSQHHQRILRHLAPSRRPARAG